MLDLVKNEADVITKLFTQKIPNTDINMYL